MPRRLLLACAIAAVSAATAAPARAACPSDEEVARLAEALVAGRLAEPFGSEMGLADAECARDKLVPMLERHWGPAIGYKVSLTSAASQQRYAIPHPVRGSIFAMTVSVADGSEVPARFGAEAPLGVESDLLVRVRDEGINSTGRDRVAILRHLDQVIPFIEMSGSGLRGRLDGPNFLAANLSARLGVVGRPIPAEATAAFAERLGAMAVVFADDTREILRAPGTALLGHPLDVIPWLVEDLALHGRRLRAGEVVSLGGFAPSVPAQPGRSYTVRYEGLLNDPVSVSVRVRQAVD